MLERGEKIELLVDKTEHLHQHAFKFAKSSTQLKRSLQWREMKCKLIAAAVTLGVLALVGMLACGGPTFDTCRSPAAK